jgi:hypothetical protein
MVSLITEAACALRDGAGLPIPSADEDYGRAGSNRARWSLRPTLDGATVRTPSSPELPCRPCRDEPALIRGEAVGPSTLLRANQPELALQGAPHPVLRRCEARREEQVRLETSRPVHGVDQTSGAMRRELEPLHVIRRLPAAARADDEGRKRS